MTPALKRAADRKVAQSPLAGASEDFSFFAQEVPGLYVFLGVTPKIRTRRKRRRTTTPSSSSMSTHS